MKTHTFATLSLSALMLGGTMVGCGMQGQGIASAGSTAHGSADGEANAARAALAARKTKPAVSHAEAAVAIAPTNATYRALLGQAYLSSGRFTSARQAFADAHQLDPRDMRFALSLALSQTASGDWTGARQTLAACTDIPAADRGLATALAGDPRGAIAILLPAARAPGATAKTRQNLALALALAGQWNEAKALAALDVAPDQLDKRMAEWAKFAQPARKSDQVASLLGVRAGADAGFPMALALNAAVPTSAAAEIASAPAALATSASPVVAPAPVISPVPVAHASPALTFGAAREVVQPVKVAAADAAAAPLIEAPSGPSRVAVLQREASSVKIAQAAPVKQALADGTYYVQLGAFENPAVARDSWNRIKRRHASLFGAHSAQGAAFALGKTRFYRLSVGGFARTDALKVCRHYRARGGECFVRTNAGDAIAQWLRSTAIKVASR